MSFSNRYNFLNEIKLVYTDELRRLRSHMSLFSVDRNFVSTEAHDGWQFSSSESLSNFHLDPNVTTLYRSWEYSVGYNQSAVAYVRVEAFQTTEVDKPGASGVVITD
jgi:hypothetical protein